MAVKFKMLWALVVMSNLCAVFSMPILQRLKTNSRVLSLDEYNDETLVRVKKAMVSVGTCAKGMIWYAGKCTSMEDYNRLQDENYDEDEVTATEPVPVTYEESEEVDKYTDTVNTDTDRGSSTSPVVSEENNLLTTDTLNENLVGTTSDSSLDNDDYVTSDRRNTLMAIVFLIGSFAVVMTWLLTMLYYRYLKREEDERDTSSLASDEEDTRDVTASSHFLTLKLPLD